MADEADGLKGLELGDAEKETDSTGVVGSKDAFFDRTQRLSTEKAAFGLHSVFWRKLKFEEIHVPQCS